MPPLTAPWGAHGLFISYARADDEAFAMRLRDDLGSHGFGVWWDRASMERRRCFPSGPSSPFPGCRPLGSSVTICGTGGGRAC